MVKLEQPVRPIHALLHPLWWIALGLLLLNDHGLKWGGQVSLAVTGKLSDVSGLLMAPALVAALLRVRTFGGWLACHAGVALTFAGLKLSPLCADAFVGLGSVFGLDYAIAPDRSDLWALAFHPELAGFELGNGLRRAEAKIVRDHAGGPVLLWKSDPPDGLQNIAAFDSASRDLLWTAPAQLLVLETPALVVTENQFALQAHDMLTGTLRWRYADHGFAYSANDRILVFPSQSTRDGVVAVDLRTGWRLWRTQAPP